MSDKYALLDNNRECGVKPIEEVLIEVKGLKKEVSSIRTDMAVIKSRLYEFTREMKQRQEQEDNIQKGWGWGFY